MSTEDYTRTEALLRAALPASVEHTMTLTDTAREYDRLQATLRRRRRRTSLLAAAAAVGVIAAGTGIGLAVRNAGDSADPGPAAPRPTAPADSRPQTTTLTPQSLPAGALLGTVPGLPPGTLFLEPWGPDAVAWAENSSELVILDGAAGTVVGRESFNVPAGATIRSAKAIPTGMVVTFDLTDADPSEDLLHVFVDSSFQERGRLTGGWTGNGTVVSVATDGDIWVASGPAEVALVDDVGRVRERVSLEATGGGFLAASEGFWLTDFYEQKTTLVDRDGKLVTTIATVEPVVATLTVGRLVVFTGRGEAYVIDRTARRVAALVRADVVPVGGWMSGGATAAYGVAGGRLLVIQPGNPSDSRAYSMAGGESATVRPSEVVARNAVAYLDGGRLWVLRDDGTLERYDPSKL